MARIVHLGAKTDRRATYFKQATEKLGMETAFYTYAEYEKDSRPDDLLKLDPPPQEDALLCKLAPFVQSYCHQLQILSRLPSVHFLNSPAGIWAALDKKTAKQRLLAAQVSTTPLLDYTASSYEELLDKMTMNHHQRVFIKPRYGSGAAGVAAFQINRQNQQVLQTSLALTKQGLINTKRVRRFSQPEKNRRLLDLLLQEDCILETWIPKDSVNGITYDLRIVYQLGKIVFAIPRGADSPITNLHLNDRPLDWAQISLPQSLWQKIDELSRQTMTCFPELVYAGLDVLIPAGDRQRVTPLIIEINGQGDLIYKDIFADNRIYSEQVRYLSSLAKYPT